MKINIIQSEKTICSNEHSIHKYFGWPSVARLQDGSLAMVASGFRLSHICPFGKLVMCRSYDEGKSWSAPEILIDTPLDDRDGGICPFGESGVVVTSFNNHPEFQRKHQGNSLYRKAYLDEVEKREFEKYLGSTIALSRDGGKTFGDVMTVPVSSPHGPSTLSDGTVLYVGRTFDAYNRPTRLECHELLPDGTTQLRSVIDVPDPSLTWCEPHAIQLPDGKIIVHIRMQGENGKYFTLYQSVSTDMGYTFSMPTRLLSDHGGAPAHLLQHSSGTLVSVYGYRDAPFGLRAMFSRDGGESWDTEGVLLDNESSADLGYPCSVELADGNILTVYYGHEDGKKHTVIRQIIWSFED